MPWVLLGIVLALAFGPEESGEAVTTVEEQAPKPTTPREKIIERHYLHERPRARRRKRATAVEVPIVVPVTDVATEQGEQTDQNVGVQNA